MKQLLFAALLIVLALPALAQDSERTVSGTVVSRDGSPIAGAEVSLSGLDPNRMASARTDASGTFVFADVSPGRYLLMASASGLVSAPASVVVPSDSVFALTLMPAPAVREFVDVEISAGTSQPVSEIAKTVDVIGRDELDARADLSLTDSMRQVPGFRVQQLGGPGRTASIKTRGLRNQDTAVLVDGMRFRDPSAITGDASAFLSELSTLGARRIEVLRGSGSSIYGTNAIGGVVDIRTAEPGSGLSGSFDGGFGGLGQRGARGEMAGGSDRFGFTASFGRMIFTEGIDGEDDYENTSGGGRVDIYATPDTVLSGRFRLSRSDVRLNVNPDTVGTLGPGVVDAVEGLNFLADRNDPDSLQDSDFFLGRLSLTHVFAPGLLLDVSYQRLGTRRINTNGELGPGFQPFGGTETSRFEGRIDTLEAKVNWTLSTSKVFTLGFEFEQEDYRNEGAGPFAGSDFFAEADQKSTSVYAQHLAGFLDGRLQLAGGIRYQAFDVGGTSFSVTNAPYGNVILRDPPRAITLDGSAAYYLRRTGTKFRVHVGNGYRVPSLYERLGTFYSSFSQEFTALGDPGLGPERSVAFDAGIDQEVTGRFRFSAAYFYTKLTDTIGFGFPVPDIGDTGRPFGGYLNEEGGIARGLEFSATARPAASTYLFASYTRTNSDQRRPQVAGTGTIRTLGIPDDQFTLVAVQEIGTRLTVSFDLLVAGSYLAPIFSGETYTTVLYRFDGNRRGDLSATYAIPVFGERARLRLRGTVQNLFGDRYFENGFRTEGRTARAGFGIEF